MRAGVMRRPTLRAAHFEPPSEGVREEQSKRMRALRLATLVGLALALVALGCSPPLPKTSTGPCKLPPKFSLRFNVDAGTLNDAGWYTGDCVDLCGGPEWSWSCRPAVDAGAADAVECVLDSVCID